jgi:hypothetical protein
MINDVRTWRDNPAANFGWALVNQSEGRSGSARGFYSSEATLNSTSGVLNPAWRPTLTVNYILIPEPATALLLLASGALAMIRVRR